MNSQRMTIVIVVFLSLLVFGGQASAQDSPFPMTPDPTLCVDQLTVEEFGALVIPTAAASPVAEAPSASPIATGPTVGTPADEETVAAINARVTQLAACINAENTLGFYGQFSPGAVSAQLSGQNITEENLAALAATTPTPTAAENWVTVIGVREVRVLADGRVGAVVGTRFPIVSSDLKIDYFIFTNVDGRWLIDSIVEGLASMTP